MSSQSRARRKRQLRTSARIVERLEDRQLLASIAEFSLSSGAAPQQIVSGSDGALWFTEPGLDQIGRIAGDGTVTEFALSIGSSPQGITAGPDGNLWFTEPGHDKIGQITTAGTVTEFALSTGSSPQGITTGPDGNLWFTEPGHDKIASIVSSGVNAGTITEFALAVGSQPYGITSGPNGNLWFTENGTNKVGEIVPSGLFAGVISEFALSGGAGPQSITTGSDGNLWFTETDGNNIGRVTLGGSVTEFAIPTSGVLPRGIISGPGGALFFTESSGNAIGRITTSGSFSEYAVPTMESGPAGITVGLDNHIWFTENSANQIGRLNLEPEATDNVYTAVQDTPLAVGAASGVLADDVDPEGDPLTAASVSDPAHGTLTFSPDGSFTYVPDAGYSGPDSFTYRVSDGTDVSSTATVSLTVRAETAPTAGDDVYRAAQDTPLVIAAPGVLGNDTDADGDPLAASIVANPTNGSLTLNPDGSFTYTPNAGYHGPDSFTYQVSDGYLSSNIATVNLTVNAPPVAVADSYTTDAGTGLPVTIPASGVLGNDSDADGDPLTAIAVTQPANGTLFLFASGLNADGTFTYYPNIGFTGTDSFTYKVNDGTTDGNTVTVTITVNPLPVATDDSYTVVQDAPLTEAAAAGVLANDAGTGALTASIVGNAAHGNVSLNADGSFAYTPDAGYHGPDSFTYKVNDGIADSNTATVNITVDAPPVAVGDTYTAIQDSPLTRNAAQGVLANDTDADGDPLSVFSAWTGTHATNHGTISLDADGSFTYTPDAGYYGPDLYGYQATDGTTQSGIVSLFINVDAPPVAVADSYTTDAGTALPVTSAASGVLANDSDADGDPLTAAIVSGPTHGSLTFSPDGSFTYTPDNGFFGTDSFTYTANDGTADGNVATVNIRVDAPPASVGDDFSASEDGILSISAPGVLGNDVDADGDPMTAVLVSAPTHGSLTFNSDGSFTYTPNPLFFGADSFTYKANDGLTDGNIATVSINVVHVNHQTTVTNDSYTTDQDMPLIVDAASGVLANDVDVDGDPLTAGLDTPPSHGVVTLNSDGSFVYTPNPGYVGPDSFGYATNDGLQANFATVNITVSHVNHAPVATADAYTTAENAPLTVPAPGVLANDADADGDPLAAVLVTGPAHGSLTLSSTGSFTYTPDANFNGSDSFTYRPSDGQAQGDVATVSLTITPVNESPVVSVRALTAVAGTPLDGVTVATFGDVDASEYPGSYTAGIDWGDGTPATVGIVTPSGGQFQVTGSHVYAASGSFTVRVTVIDPAGGIGSQTASATVSPIAPQFNLTGTIASTGQTSSAGVMVTSDPKPSVTGTAAPGYIVTLFASTGGLSTLSVGSTNPQPNGVPVMIGQAVAGADGSFHITSGTLPDGTYTLGLSAYNPAAPDSSAVPLQSLGKLTIDTTPPAVTGVRFNPRTRQFVVSFADGGTGLDLSTVMDTASYMVTRPVNRYHRPLIAPVTGASVVSSSGGVTTVAVTVGPRRWLKRGQDIFAAFGGKIKDSAGNGLAGRFTGTLPTGGAAGTDFAARFRVNGHKVSKPHHLPYAAWGTLNRPGHGAK